VNPQLTVLGNEIITLRSFLDYIVWGVFKGEHSSIRRLQAIDGAHSFSVKNIEDHLVIVQELNEDPLSIAIVNDATTVVHIGDILKFNFLTGVTEFIEVKSGKKNISLSHLAQTISEEGQELYESIISQMNEYDKKHFERIVRQLDRGKKKIDILKNDTGYDPNLKQHVNLFTVDSAPENYSKEIVSCYEKIKQQSYAIAEIDECLYIGLYRNKDYAATAFGLWMNLIKNDSKIYNITDSFFIPSAKPLSFIDLPLEIIEDLMAGDLFRINAVNHPSWHQPNFAQLYFLN
jgi:hypothetical protein